MTYLGSELRESYSSEGVPEEAVEIEQIEQIEQIERSSRARSLAVRAGPGRRFGPAGLRGIQVPLAVNCWCRLLEKLFLVVVI
jgi:hypothetical protein